MFAIEKPYIVELKRWSYVKVLKVEIQSPQCIRYEREICTMWPTEGTKQKTLLSLTSKSDLQTYFRVFYTYFRIIRVCRFLKNIVFSLSTNKLKVCDT